MHYYIYYGIAASIILSSCTAIDRIDQNVADTAVLQKQEVIPRLNSAFSKINDIENISASALAYSQQGLTLTRENSEATNANLARLNTELQKIRAVNKEDFDKLLYKFYESQYLYSEWIIRNNEQQSQKISEAISFVSSSFISYLEYLDRKIESLKKSEPGNTDDVLGLISEDGERTRHAIINAENNIINENKKEIRGVKSEFSQFARFLEAQIKERFGINVQISKADRDAIGVAIFITPQDVIDEKISAAIIKYLHTFNENIDAAIKNKKL